MGRLKVMHVIARMNVGGPAIEISQLMNGLDDSEIEQSLVTGWCADGEADYLDLHPVQGQVHRIPGLGRKLRPADDLLVLGRIRNLIKSTKPDIVHTHTAKAGVLGRLAARGVKPRPKVIHTHHGHLLHGYFDPLKTRAIIEAERQLARMTDLSIAVGQRVRDDLLAAGIGHPARFLVIRSGVALRQLPSRSDARQALGIQEGIPVVSMIGRITQIKRPDRFADAVVDLVANGVTAEFLVAGGGDKTAYLQERVQRDQLPVRLLGWRDDVETLLAATDLLVLTSDNEGTPLSLIQAGLARIPVVATHVGSVHEIVQHERTGILTAKSADAVASAMCRILGDPRLGSRLGAAAYQHVWRRFSIEGFLQSHIDTYRRLGEASGARRNSRYGTELL